MAESSLSKEEITGLARSVINEVTLYNKIPQVKGGCVICDEEHFRGEHLSSEILEKECGVFVSILKNGQLRGRAGALKKTENSLAQDIIRWSVGSARQDPSFEELSKEELSEIKIKVVLTGKVQKIDSWKDVPLSNLLIVKKNWRQGISFPDEGFTNKKERLDKILEYSDIALEEEPDFFTAEVQIFSE